MAANAGAGALSRRRFLELASWTAAAGALPRLAFAGDGEEARAAASGEATVPLSVGYVVGSEDLADVARPPWWPVWLAASTARAAAGRRAVAAPAAPLDVLPAAELPGDPYLAVVPVRVAVLGLYPELDDVPGATFDMVLTAEFVTGDPLVPELTFYAWGWRDDPAPSSGAPLRFTVPVERESGLRLTLDVRTAQAGGARAAARRSAWRQETVLSPGIESGVPKLQRGLYLLGLDRGMWDRPGELPAGALPDELSPSLVLGIEAEEGELTEG